MTDTQKISDKQTAEVFKLVRGMLHCQNTLYGCQECDSWVEKINAIFEAEGNWLQLKKLTKKDQLMTDKLQVEKE